MKKIKIYKFLILEIKGKIEAEKDIFKYGICVGCNNFEDGMCVAEELIYFPYKPRKKKCKYFEKLEDYPDEFEIEDYYEYLDSGVI